MKQKTDPGGCGVKVCSIQATKKGGIRLKVMAKAKGNLLEFQREIKEKTNLATNAEVIRTTGLIVIRDLDESASKEEVEEAVCRELGSKAEISVRS